MTKHQYESLINSDKLLEHYPSCTGIWNHDEPIINFGNWFIETDRGRQSIYNLDELHPNLLCIFSEDTLKAMLNNYSAQQNYEFCLIIKKEIENR